MPSRRFGRIALAQMLVAGCAVAFGACVLIEHARAQPGYVPPPTPLPPPVFNPSNPGTVPQPSYRPITPSTPSTVPSIELTPAYEEFSPRRTARAPAGISLWGRADLPSLLPHSSWTTADRIFLCWLRLSVLLATVVGRILVSNVALFLVKREGLRPTWLSWRLW